MIDLLKKYITIVLMFFCSLLFFAIHTLVGKGYLVNYSEVSLHSIFASFSIAIVLILTILYYKKPNYVGYSFMAITTLKMLILVVVFKKTIQTAPEILKPEKMTILLLFLIYLAVETILIVQLLNKNQNK